MGVIRVFLVLLFAVTPFLTQGSETINIGILTETNPESVVISIREGNYYIKADGIQVEELHAGERAKFSWSSGKVKVELGGTVKGTYAAVSIHSKTWPAHFNLTTLHPKKIERVYDDDLIIKPKTNKLLLINQVNLEKYIAGVVESESGKNQSLEFYKAQAIIARTYALSSKRKHLHEGFNLNDRVDCQVYLGKSRFDPNIIKATEETFGIVLVDANLNLITAAYHSNSGGYTVNSEDVWSKPESYLVAREDSFSLGAPHYHWEKMISKEKWLEYLADKYNFPVQDKLLFMMATNYKQPKKELWFIDPNLNIPLKELRKDWRLNSTFFDITEKGDSLHFTGRGFGHGIGLSQEGAMKMATLGYSYQDILMYYYKDVHLVKMEFIQMMQAD